MKIYKTYIVKRLIKKFLTPIKYIITEREKMFYRSAKHIKMYIPSIKKEIIVYEYGYSKNKNLIVHGWSGRCSQFYMLADKLLENGKMVIGFDAPAHGNSKGNKSSMHEFSEIIKFLHAKYSFTSAIGHSLGANTLLQNTSNDLKINKLVVVSASNHIDEIFLKFLLSSKENINLLALLKKRFKEKDTNSLGLYNGINCAKKIKIPTLIIHDSQDKPSNVSNAYNIRQNLQNGEILVTYNLGHTRILKNNFINNRIIEFLNHA